MVTLTSGLALPDLKSARNVLPPVDDDKLVQLNTRISKERLRKLKRHCVDNDISLVEFMAQTIDKLN